MSWAAGTAFDIEETQGKKQKERNFFITISQFQFHDFTISQFNRFNQIKRL